MIKIKKYETIDITFRKLNNGKYVIIAHASSWKKAHAVNPAHPYQHGMGIQLDSIGQCFEYSRKYFVNARCKHELSVPLASSDHYHGMIDDLPVSYKE